MKKHRYTLLSPYNLLFIGLSLLIASCGTSNNRNDFEFHDARHTHVNFDNSIPDSDIINILSFEYIYNGGGVGCADFNRDGKEDLFFAGNFVDNALYLNTGDFEFTDISEIAGIKAKGKWCTGITIVDINNDSWPDIYISVNSFNTNEITDNLLFVHNGLDKNGIPTFSEEAKKYGVEGGKHSMHAAFFDYDLDGDLDLYVLNNILDLVSPSDYRVKQKDGNAPNSDQLLRNDNGKYVDVSKDAGILIEGYGLGLAITDINKDGYPDIYVANDYITNDLFYINQKDGTFRNEIESRISKQSKFSMGVSASDFNNDGQKDLFVLDMLSNTNERLKKLNPSSNYNNPILNAKYDYQEQNVRNMLQVSNGSGSFTELAFQAGVFASDWSWTPLCEDFDLDGDIDIYVTNGFPKDITDLDFINYKANRSMAFNRTDIIEQIPIIKISNIYFENQGNLKFENITNKKGLNNPSFSNGAIAVDLDNDGDLDIVSNNINQAAFIIENKTAATNYLQLSFDTSLLDSEIIGTKIFAYQGEQIQYKEYFPHQSYLSSASSKITFGLGEKLAFDSIAIIFPDLSKKVISSLDEKMQLTIKKDQLSAFVPTTADQQGIPADTIFLAVPNYKIFDANLQTTIPFDYSHFGPKLVDSKLGIIACVGKNQFPKLIKGNASSDFDVNPALLGVTNGIEFDIDNNGSLDLLFTKASYQYSEKSNNSLVTLLNKKGRYVLDTVIFSGIEGDHLLLEIADIDKDGDVDLFLGSSYKSGQYPKHFPHYLAINNGKNGSSEYEIKEIGHDFGLMDAVWEDINQDGYPELHMVGHWQAITSYTNNSGEINTIAGVQLFGEEKGLWNNLHFTDLNNDSKPDLIVGNMGLNTHLGKGPLRMVAEDLDNNGTIDPIAFFKYDSEFTPLPLRDELISQVPGKKKEFPNYLSYSKATLNNFFSAEELESFRLYEVNHMKTSIYLSGDEGFESIDIPTAIQRAPVCASNTIGSLTILGGNFSYGTEFWGSFNSSQARLIEFQGEELKLLDRQLPEIKGDVRSILVKNDKVYITTTENIIIHFPYKQEQ